ncbi:MAG: hypothetical protein QMB94_12320, partial [Phycisphaerales bacterium]
MKSFAACNFTAELVIPEAPQNRPPEQDDYHRTIGSWKFQLTGNWDLGSFGDQTSERTATAGNWPHPPSMKLSCKENDWSLIPDYTSLMPIYYRRSIQG